MLVCSLRSEVLPDSECIAAAHSSSKDGSQRCANGRCVLGEMRSVSLLTTIKWENPLEMAS